MYPSYGNRNTTPVSYNLDQTIPYRPTLHEINPNSKLEDSHSSSLFHFPSPYIHYEDNIVLLQHLHDLLLQQQPLTAEGSPPEAIFNMADSIKNDADGRKEEFNKQCHSVIEQIPRKRSSKKDRHSKINTAQGLRDRRMRLSLKVAEEFFDLQDMLGFDKASKTVEWLLNKSKAAIQDLNGDHLPHTTRSCDTVRANSASSTSEYEVVSGNDELVKGNQLVRTTVSKEKKIRAFRKSAFHPLSKESRERAREKARERTREKRKLRESELPLETLNHDMSRLGSWSPFEIGEELGAQNQNINPPIEVLEELSSSIIFNNMTGISQEHQFTDFRAYGKPWEAYSNINLC